MRKVAPEVKRSARVPSPNEGNTSISEEYARAADYRYLPIWKRALFKIKVRAALQIIGEELMVFGTSNELSPNPTDKDNLEAFLTRKANRRASLREMTTGTSESPAAKRCLLHPDSAFKKVWNSMLALLLIYTALIMPYRLAFSEQVFWDVWTDADLAIDGVFLLDVVVNFFSMYVRADGTLETGHRRIVRGYVTRWFLVDLASSFPITLVDYYTGGDADLRGKYNSMVRLARLPRLYKLLRIVRILKVLKHYSNSPVFLALHDCLQINSRLWKLVKFLLSVLLCVHIFGCLWYFTARIVDFDVTCWVVRTGSLDSSDLHKYLLAIYWAISTAATVGYGDIVPYTSMEVLLAVSWMVVGVGFYSYTVGSLSSFLTSIDTRDSVLAMKLAAVTEFSKETGISQEIRNKLREAVKYNAYRMGNVWSDKHSLFTELPKALKYEVVWSVYEGAVKDFAVFSLFDSAFVAALVPLLVPLRLEDGEYVYNAGDYPDEVFFILHGRINFVLQPSEIAYKSFLRGSYIGEIELFQKVNRLNSALCFGIGELLVLSKPDFARILAEFPVDAKEFRRLAFERASRNKQAYLETLELLKMKAALGSLDILAGRDRILNVENELDSEVPIAEQFQARLTALQEEAKSHLLGLLKLGETVLKAQELLQTLLETTDRPPFVELAERTVQEVSTEEEGVGNYV